MLVPAEATSGAMTTAARADVGDEVLNLNAGRVQVHLRPLLVALEVESVPLAGDDVGHRRKVAQPRPALAQEELNRQQIGQMREGADEEQAARFRFLRGRAEEVQIDAVGEADTGWQPNSGLGRAIR